jgi:hypothetical protein
MGAATGAYPSAPRFDDEKTMSGEMFVSEDGSLPTKTEEVRAVSLPGAAHGRHGHDEYEVADDEVVEDVAEDDVEEVEGEAIEDEPDHK